jgi:hypothetical protein
MALANWLISKVLLADARYLEDTVMGFAERINFRTARAMPSALAIRIGWTATTAFSGSFYRHATTIGKNVYDAPPDGRKNTHSIFFGMGQLFVFALIDGGGNFSLDAAGGHLVDIVPLHEPLAWPPRASTDAEARQVAQCLDDLLKSGRVRWLPQPNATDKSTDKSAPSGLRETPR